MMLTTDIVYYLTVAMSKFHDSDMCVSSTLLHNSYVLAVSCRLRPHVTEELETTHVSVMDDVPAQLHIPPQSVPAALQPGTVWNEDFLGGFGAPLRRGSSGSSGTMDNDRHPANDLAPTSGVP